MLSGMRAFDMDPTEVTHVDRGMGDSESASSISYSINTQRGVAVHMRGKPAFENEIQDESTPTDPSDHPMELGHFMSGRYTKVWHDVWLVAVGGSSTGHLVRVRDTPIYIIRCELILFLLSLSLIHI